MHGDVVPGVARAPGLDALTRVGAVVGGEEIDQRGQARALGGAGGHDVEEVLVLEGDGDVAPAVRDLGLHTGQERRIGDAQRDADDGAPGQIRTGRLREQSEQGGIGADRVVELKVAVERGDEDRDTGLALEHVEDLLGEAIGQGPGLQDAVVGADQGGTGVEHGIVEGQVVAAQGRAQRGHRPSGVGHEEVAGVAPACDGGQISRGDGRIEQERAIDVGGQELAHRPSLRAEIGSKCRPDRFRCGTEPISSRSTTDLGGWTAWTAQAGGTLRSSSAIQAAPAASDGMRQSPRGDSEPPATTLGPSGSVERLNWLEKKRRRNSNSHLLMVAKS